MAVSLNRVRVAPKGMGLNDFVAMQEGFFAAEGIEVEFDWKTFRGTQSSWKGHKYLQRPQDHPYTEDKQDVIQCACLWGTISNASAGMGRLVTEGYGDSPWAIFVRPESKIRKPEDLKDIPISSVCARAAISTYPIASKSICRSRTSRPSTPAASARG